MFGFVLDGAVGGLSSFNGVVHACVLSNLPSLFLTVVPSAIWPIVLNMDLGTRLYASFVGI